MAAPTQSISTVASIMAAAKSLFLAKNYAEVTMDRIAEKSDLTKGALYHHFSSKEELYLEMMHADLAQKREIFTAAIDSSEDCRERLRQLTKAFFDLPPEKRELIKLVQRDINVFRDPARANLVRAYQQSLPELVERVIRDGIENGKLAPGDPRLLSWHFVSMVQVTLDLYADSLFDDSDQKLDYVLNLFFDGAVAAKQARRGVTP
ncbi:MAG: TetR/AcrR family transcriptional regulator [Fuerstiella sp.]|nr:TetR/AcrR family transcriptional regulator [Fuerstiella sp.]